MICDDDDDWLIDWLFDWLFDWLIKWLIKWLIDDNSLIDWLICYLGAWRRREYKASSVFPGCKVEGTRREEG